MRRGAGLLATFVLGGIGGALCDQIHLRAGVLGYPRPFLLGQPWWVAPVFGAGTVLILAAARPFARGGAPSPSELIAAAAWFLAAYAGSGLVGDRAPILYAIALSVTWGARVARSPSPAAQLVFGLALAAGGCAFEALLSSTGAFAYAHPFWWVPVWLPGIYLHGAPLALAVARARTPRGGSPSG